MSKPITQSQYFEYIITKDLLESGLEHLKEKEAGETDATDDEEKTGLPKLAYDRLIDTLAREMTGIPLDSEPISNQPQAQHPAAQKI